jgi:hypothetical protein
VNAAHRVIHVGELLTDLVCSACSGNKFLSVYKVYDGTVFYTQIFAGEE